MESESLDEPTALALFELNIEEQPATVDELRTWASQFVEDSRHRWKVWDAVVRVPHPIVIRDSHPPHACRNDSPSFSNCSPSGFRPSAVT
jgi:hypothetical protein